jgi:hypothetical protein
LKSNLIIPVKPGLKRLLTGLTGILSLCEEKGEILPQQIIVAQPCPLSAERPFSKQQVKNRSQKRYKNDNNQPEALSLQIYESAPVFDNIINRDDIKNENYQ